MTATDPYLKLADDLRTIADRLDTLAGNSPVPYVALDLMPNGDDEAAEVAGVDAIGRILLGREGETKPMLGGVYHHTLRGRVGAVSVAAYCRVRPPDERDQEIARLRAENEALRAGVEASAVVNQAAAEVPADLAPRHEVRIIPAYPSAQWVCVCGLSGFSASWESATKAGALHVERAPAAERAEPSAGVPDGAAESCARARAQGRDQVESLARGLIPGIPE